MKPASTLFLKSVAVILGLIVLALCIFALPAGFRSPGANAYHPILIGLYVTAIPFYLALYQTLKLLSHIDKNNAFSTESVATLKQIRNHALIIAAAFTLGSPYLYYVADLDDAPGVLAIGLVIIFASVVIAVFAAVLEKLLQNAIKIKAENDLTV